MGAHFDAERIQPRFSLLGRLARRDRRRSRQTLVRVALWSLIAILGLAFAGQLVYHFAISPALVLRHLEVQGDPILGEAEAAAAAGLRFGAPLAGLDLERARSRLEAAPSVKRAALKRQLPDTVVVQIEARRPLAMALAAVQGATVPVLIDEEGLILAAGTAAAVRDLPVISGLDFASSEPGTRLPPMLLPVLDDLRRLRRDEPALFAFISEVSVTRAGERGLEVLVYPSTYGTPVRVGSRISAEVLKNAVLLLDVVRRERLDDRVREVDLRTREIVYRERGGG